MNAFRKNLNRFENYVQGLFSLYEWNLVVYDETENFKEYYNEHFEYPFDPRKSNIGQVSFEYYNEEQKLQKGFWENYKYASKNIMF